MLASPQLLSRRVLFVVGKGGVGKSVISAGLATLASSRGQRTVVAEMGGAETLSALFDTEPVGYGGAELAPGLRAVSVRPAEAIEEYLVRMLRFRLLYTLVFRNRSVAPFMDGVMGLSDLISVGKVMDLEWELTTGPGGPNAVGERRHDLVVVDCPATGHGLSLLRAPQAMMDLARVGPLHNNARLIQDLLSDRERTAVILVTLAEEMPVTETIELGRALAERVDVEVAGVVVNATPSRLFTGDAERAWPEVREAGLRAGGHAAEAVHHAERALRERSRAEGYMARLRDELGLPLLEVPLLQRRDIDPGALAEVARHLEPWA